MKKQKYHFVQDVKRMKYFWKSETMELESHQNDLPRITDKGYTGTTGRNYQKSTGMGLYLCKKLCSKLQLSFYIESKEEEYTKVTIGFPRNSMIFFK